MPTQSPEKPLNEMNYTELETKVHTSPAEDTKKAREERVKELVNVSTELEKRRGGYPTNEEVMRTYEGLATDERIDLVRKLLNRALEETSIKTADQAQNKTGERIFLAHEPETPDTPQAYFKQVITEERNFLGKPIINKSDELLLVVRLNNGSTPETNTVVVCTVKHINGVPQINEDERGTFLITTQKEYDKQTSPKKEDVQAQWLRGELTNDFYLDEYKRQNKISLYDVEKKRDEDLTNIPEHWTAEREKGDLFAKAEDKYGKLLQEAQLEIENVKTHTKELLKAENDKREQILNSEDWKAYKNAVDEWGPDDEKTKRVRRILERIATNEQIDKILNKKK